MQFEFDPEGLIKEVKKRPGLWDRTCDDHRRKSKRDKLWQEVAAALNPCSVEITKSEQKELEYQLHRKWKGLRDSFFKYINNPRTKRPYIYMKQMSFLLKEQDVKILQKKRVDDFGSDKKGLSWVKKEKISLNVQSSDDEDAQDNDYEVYQPQSHHEVSLNEPMDQQDGATNSEFIFADVETETLSKNDTEEADKLFLLSLLPHLMAVPEKNKIVVKMNLMSVLQEAQE